MRVSVRYASETHKKLWTNFYETFGSISLCSRKGQLFCLTLQNRACKFSFVITRWRHSPILSNVLPWHRGQFAVRVFLFEVIDFSAEDSTFVIA